MKTYRIVAVCLVLVLLAAGGYVLLRPRASITVSADFTQADGVFVGNDVDILGVRVGSVRSLRPMGTTVRVTMSLPEGTQIPANAQAWVLTPDPISDQHIELTPAYTTGATMADGAVIPVDRTHSPIKWDQLTQSLNTLLTALGPTGSTSPLGSALHNAAQALNGNGPALRSAIQNLTQASGVLAGDSGDASALLANLNTLVGALAARKSTVDSLTTSVDQTASAFDAERANISATLGELTSALTDVTTLIKDHATDVTSSLTDLTTIAATLAQHQQDLAEAMNTLPLVFDNFGNAITPDEHMRIRVDISSNLSQFSSTAALCQRIPIPLCSGAGIVNPVSFPPDLSNPLGLAGGR